MMLFLLLWLAQSPFAFHAVSPTSLELTENGKPVFVYNYGMMLKEGVPEDRRRADYLHPVYTPGGTVITDDFPKDHYHHRGISWMWPVVVVDGHTYNLWEIHGIHQKFVRWIARETGPETASLRAENGWFIGDRKVVKEAVGIVAHRTESGRRRLDLTLTFEALGKPVAFAGTPDHQKGYGGLSFRFAPREQTVIRTDAGTEDQDSNLVPHPWAELIGTFGGHRAGARVEIDPANPAFPNGWCLRHYGFLGVDYPGLQPHTLQPGQPLVLKYRIILFD